jgi:hypothetical protein
MGTSQESGLPRHDAYLKQASWNEFTAGYVEQRMKDRDSGNQVR